jgi:hypothetical protein
VRGKGLSPTARAGFSSYATGFMEAAFAVLLAAFNVFAMPFVCSLDRTIAMSKSRQAHQFQAHRTITKSKQKTLLASLSGQYPAR